MPRTIELEIAKIGPQGAPGKDGASISNVAFDTDSRVLSITTLDSEFTVTIPGGATGDSYSITLNFNRDNTLSVTGGSATVDYDADTITVSGVTLGATVNVQVNGINFTQGTEYTVSGNVITFPEYDLASGSGDQIIITG